MNLFHYKSLVICLTINKYFFKMILISKNIEIGVILLLFALLVFLIFPTTNKFTNCFSVVSGKLEQDVVIAYKDKEIFCKNGQEIILSLNTCLKNVKEENILAPLLFKLASLFPSVKNTNNILDKHNQVCPQYPVPEFF